MLIVSQLYSRRVTKIDSHCLRIDTTFKGPAKIVCLLYTTERILVESRFVGNSCVVFERDVNLARIRSF